MAQLIPTNSRPFNFDHYAYEYDPSYHQHSVLGYTAIKNVQEHWSMLLNIRVQNLEDGFIKGELVQLDFIIDPTEGNLLGLLCYILKSIEGAPDLIEFPLNAMNRTEQDEINQNLLDQGFQFTATPVVGCVKFRPTTGTVRNFLQVLKQAMRGHSVPNLSVSTPNILKTIT